MKQREKRRKSTAKVGVTEQAEYFDEDVEFDDEFVEDEEGIEEDVPNKYQETSFETTCVRCCGACCLIFMGLLIVSWVVHAIPVATITDVPAFARSVLWMSIAHHTDAWNSAQARVSPPPPRFGDGAGHFPD